MVLARVNRWAPCASKAMFNLLLRCPRPKSIIVWARLSKLVVVANDLVLIMVPKALKWLRSITGVVSPAKTTPINQ